MQFKRTSGLTIRQKRWLIPAIALVVIAVGIGAVAIVKNRSSNTEPTTATTINPTNTVDYSLAKPEDNKISDSKKDDPSDKGNTDDGTNSDANFNVIITRVTVDNTNKRVQVGTQIDGASSGGCTVIATKIGQANITSTARIDSDVNSYTCGVFNMPFSQFTAKGDWKISLSVNSNGATKTVNWPQPVTIPSEQ